MPAKPTPERRFALSVAGTLIMAILIRLGAGNAEGGPTHGF